MKGIEKEYIYIYTFVYIYICIHQSFPEFWDQS